MKNLLKSLLAATLLASALLYLSGCNDDDDPGPQLTGDSKTYNLGPISNPAISGTVTFAERDDGQVLITIQLTGTQSGNMHPAHIHANSAAAGGSIVLDLADINGADGKSETVVKALNDDTPLTYEDLLDFDGYVNVHLSATELGTLIAQGDIGRNELTGDNKVYTLTPVADPAVTGTATFAKRKSGKTLVTVALTGTAAGASHASHIHANTIAEGGSIVINLKNVDGTTGMAQTTVDSLNNGDAITYEELLDFNGYLNVHVGSSFVAQGDIGQNELTGENKVFTLNEVTGSGISGTATFAERESGKTMITISLDGTTAGGNHPAHIHANNAATGGGIVLDLKNVNGDTGKSVTSANALNSGTAITYDELLGYNGHINVHLSPTELGTRIAQGNIGSNAP